MMPPTVTVLVPTYNRAALIGEALHSILQQTFVDFEVLVLDDGSTDSTPQVLADFTDPRLRVLRLPHRGISSTLNAGLREARGRYVARLDSDDLWLPEMLALLVPVLETRPEVGAVYGQADALEDGRVIPHLQGLPLRFPEDSLRSLVYDDCTCNIALVARRTCLDLAGPYDESLIANEDWDMWLRVARHTSIVFVNHIVAHVRWHHDNLTGLQSPHLRNVLATRTRPLDKLFAERDLPPQITGMRSTAYANVHLFCGMRLWQAGDRRGAYSHFTRMIRTSDQHVVAAIRILWRALLQPVLVRSYAGRAVTRYVAWWYKRVGP